MPLSPLDPLRFLVSEERIARHLEKYAFDVYIRLVLLHPAALMGCVAIREISWILTEAMSLGY